MNRRLAATNLALELAGERPFVLALYALHAFFVPLQVPHPAHNTHSPLLSSHTPALTPSTPAFVPRQGLGNAAAYGNLPALLLACVRTHCLPRSLGGTPHSSSASSPAMSLAVSRARSPVLSFRVPVHPAAATGSQAHLAAATTASAAAAKPSPLPPEAAALRIYASTWNLGRGRAPSAAEVRSWLPGGRDLYALALQECFHVRAVTAAAVDALGGPTAYSAHVRSIGSAQLGGHIVMLVLVRAALERSGALREVGTAVSAVNRGKQLLPSWLVTKFRAANKGAVGAAFRFHGTTIALVGCHLSSDSKGKSKVGIQRCTQGTLLYLCNRLTVWWCGALWRRRRWWLQVGKRLEDTAALLEGMELAYDVLGFELQLCWSAVPCLFAAPMPACVLASSCISAGLLRPHIHLPMPRCTCSDGGPLCSSLEMCWQPPRASAR